ncbi:Hypothetical predicted protein [Marmota monax]|uniref:Uncharacterized protein n=2 Tax=Marmota monax TaxID=9995 RepID=A0A5E4A6N2_MARMO|nr:Hypothetical predicted protein [Marmota monax]
MDTNQRCYPVHLSRGSARKYTDLSHGAISEDQTMGPADLDHESSSQQHRNMGLEPATQHGI